MGGPSSNAAVFYSKTCARPSVDSWNRWPIFKHHSILLKFLNAVHIAGRSIFHRSDPTFNREPRLQTGW